MIPIVLIMSWKTALFSYNSHYFLTTLLNFPGNPLKSTGKDARISLYVEETGGFSHDIINIMSWKAFFAITKSNSVGPGCLFKIPLFMNSFTHMSLIHGCRPGLS